MLAKKQTWIAIAAVFLGLVGLIMYKAEAMKPEAALSNTHSQQASSATEPMDTAPQSTLQAALEKETVANAEDLTKSAGTNASKSGVEENKRSTGAHQDAAAGKSDALTPTAAATVKAVVDAPAQDSGVQQTTPANSTPSDDAIGNTPAQNQTGAGVEAGDDPAPNTKKVTLSDDEIAKVVEQFKQQANSDPNEPDWKSKADQLIVKGFGYLGTPYVYGAKTGQTDSFDCSSFLKYIFASQKVSLPRDSRQQSQRGTSVSIDQLREGDLVFFTTPQRKDKTGIDHIGHVAVYLGNGLMLHTFRPGIGVTISELDGAWKRRFVTAKRVLN